MTKHFFKICCIAVIFATGGNNLHADEKSELNAGYPQCTKEELMMFFPQPIVKKILMNAKVDAAEADSIAKELAGKDQGMAKIVDQKAAQYNPNPFKDLSQRDQAIKIYQETLFDVFATVLKGHGIKDENQIQSLLDEIRTMKSKMFIECIRLQQQQSASARKV